MNEVVSWIESALPKLKSLVADERRVGVEILELLAECERRKAYAELGCDGLFSFCVKVLGFTEAQSYQRIQAMRAMRVTPELKEKIESGVMSVSTVAQVQGVIRKERAQGITRTALERRDLFARFENKTSLEVKREIAQVMGQRIKLRVTLELDEEAEALWREVKEKSAHKTGGDELNLMKMLMKQWLGVRGKREGAGGLGSVQYLEKDILKEPSENSGISAKSQNKTRAITNTKRDISWLEKSRGMSHPNKVSDPSQQNPNAIQRHLAEKVKRRIPTDLQRQVYQRDQGKCRNCGSKYALQIDHIVPFANVGMHELANLRLLCRNCNLSHGVKAFGLEKMKR